ncbi:hypothetical protein [Mycolicibacterium neoaurum]|uniref:Bacteriophage protein n=1 Tax=Mycolicibacterium neoaurum TaxID=1795 RepID=A0AAV2WG62_MYCNE|nr:hypothetical protein [Mycolicibacterium neoaurum]TLH50356.1 hypothetical protein C1S81_20260 [Mycolicibacterium neoaurum]CDQ43192.1 putative bacteriophage protein [Mycolicibacterium neoaurum]
MTVHTTPRFNPVDFEQLWSVLPFGSEGGYATESDALPRVTHLADGVALDVVWREVQQIINVWNEHRSALSSLLSYYTTVSADAIPQAQTEDYFELATEFGEPESLRAPSDHLLVSYTLNDFDKASRFTWRALRAMSQEQVRANLNYALEADNRLVNGSILLRLFSPEQIENEFGSAVYGLYNADNFKPPTHLGKTFGPSHSHYLVSGSDQVDSGDLDTLIRHVTEHGFGMDNGSQLVLLCNPAEADTISTFRVGTESATGVFPRYDFVPSEGAPAFYAPDEIVGKRAPEKLNGLRVSGSYGPLWIIPDDLIPEGYVTAVATYGPNSPSNCIAVREHGLAQYRGFRTIPGSVPGYPLLESFYTRSFGTGVRRRGQAAVMQIKTSGPYETPAIAGLAPGAMLV